MITRRQVLKTGAAMLAGGAVSAALRDASAAQNAAAATQPPIPAPPGQSYVPVVTLNGSSLAWKMDNGVKVFHLMAEPSKTRVRPWHDGELLGFQRLRTRPHHRGDGGRQDTR